jgi:HdeA/HdeB family
MLRRIALAFALMLVGAVTPAPEAPPASRIDIAKLTCKDLRDASPLDRSAVVMFYWGYAAAKANATSFKTGVLKNATTALMQECDAHESETILAALSRINVKAF